MATVAEITGPVSALADRLTRLEAVRSIEFSQYNLADTLETYLQVQLPQLLEEINSLRSRLSSNTVSASNAENLARKAISLHLVLKKVRAFSVFRGFIVKLPFQELEGVTALKLCLGRGSSTR